MDKKAINLTDLFPNFQNKDDFFQRITSEEGAIRKIFYLYMVMSVFSFLYGVSMKIWVWPKSDA